MGHHNSPSSSSTSGTWSDPYTSWRISQLFARAAMRSLSTTTDNHRLVSAILHNASGVALTHIQPPPNPLRAAVEAVREVGVGLCRRVQVPPYVLEYHRLLLILRLLFLTLFLSVFSFFVLGIARVTIERGLRRKRSRLNRG